jgi:hypothetical protein
MVRKSFQLVIAVLLVALACAVIAPPQVHAAVLTTDSDSPPIVKALDSAVDWLRHLWWPGPITPPTGSPWYKFGAGHTSDGHAVTKSFKGSM